MRHALGDFLPGGGLLGAEQFGEVVDDQNVTGAAAARPQGAQSHGGVHDVAADAEFQFFGGTAQA